MLDGYLVTASSDSSGLSRHTPQHCYFSKNFYGVAGNWQLVSVMKTSQSTMPTGLSAMREGRLVSHPRKGRQKNHQTLHVLEGQYQNRNFKQVRLAAMDLATQLEPILMKIFILMLSLATIWQHLVVLIQHPRSEISLRLIHRLELGSRRSQIQNLPMPLEKSQNHQNIQILKSQKNGKMFLKIMRIRDPTLFEKILKCGW